MKVYVVKIRQAEDEPWNIFRIYKDEETAKTVAKSIRKHYNDYPKAIELEYEVY